MDYFLRRKMGVEKIYRLIMLLLAIAAGAIGVVLYMTWLGVREENTESRLNESRLAYQIDKLKKDNAYKEEYFRRLVFDDEFAERVIREKMGYVGRDELVFRFKDSTPVSVDGDFKPRSIPKLSPDASDGEKSSAAPAAETLSEAEQGGLDADSAEKSFLRRLFSRGAEHRAGVVPEPQIRIDMSAPAEAPKPAVKAAPSKSLDVPAIGEAAGVKPSDTFKTESFAPSEPEPKTASKIPSEPKKATRNAIRFDAR